MSRMNFINQLNNRQKTVERAQYGVYNNPVFGPCTSEELINLVAGNGTISDVFRFLAPRSSREKRVEWFTKVWSGTAGTAANPATAPISWQSDPCDTAIGSEWGGAMQAIEGFGRLRVATPRIDETRAAIRNCYNTPRFYNDGNNSQILDDIMWGQSIAIEALMQDLHRSLVTGNKSSSVSVDDPEQFDGLQRLVKRGYVDSRTGEVTAALDSIVVDYNGQDMCPPAASPATGVTYNGSALIAPTLYKVVKRAVMDIVVKAKRSGLGRIATGDIALLLPSGWIPSFLQCVVCDVFCQGNPQGLTTIEAQNYLASLSGGLYGQGQFQVNNLTVPVIEFDQLENADGSCDAYVLTAQIGSNPTLQLQYNDMTVAVDAHNARARSSYWVSYDDGMVLFAPEGNAGTCSNYFVESQPRLVPFAPWAQARIMDIAAPADGYPIMSFDPTKPSFIETNLVNQATPLMPL